MVALLQSRKTIFPPYCLSPRKHHRNQAVRASRCAQSQEQQKLTYCSNTQIWTRRVTVCDGVLEPTKEWKYLLEIIALECSSVYEQTEAELRVFLHKFYRPWHLCSHFGPEYGTEYSWLRVHRLSFSLFFLIQPSPLPLCYLLDIRQGIGHQGSLRSQ